MSIRIPSVEIRTSAGKVDTVIVPVPQDKNGKPTGNFGGYSEAVKRLNATGVFRGGLKSAHFVRFGAKDGADNVLFAGFGKPEGATGETLRQLGGTIGGRLRSEKAATALIDLADFKAGAKGFKELGWKEAFEAFLEGALLSLYPIHGYKSEKAPQDPLPKFVIVPAGDKETVKEIVDRVLAVTEAVYLARDWSNEPSNTGTPEFYAAQARKLATQQGLKVKVLNESQARAEKMNLLLGVAQGADAEAKVVIVEYKPKRASKNAKTVVFVGKGVTFDSGGISIKPSASMEDMKHDMSGAADVFAAILLASKLEVPNHVVAIMGFTENMPGGKAMNPGSVVTGRSGKTVEIINTDAEGRLVLADLLDYAHQYKPEVIIDVATLTGAIGYALGKQCCGLFTNDSDLADSLKRLGDETGERMWELPMYDEYLEHLKSDYADLKNVSAGNQGGSVTAAIFLKQFIKKGVRWAHLDVAYTAWDLGHIPYHPKRGATGAYVRTLARFAQNYE